MKKLSTVIASTFLLLASGQLCLAELTKTEQYNKEAEQKLDEIIIPQITLRQAKPVHILEFINYSTFENDNTDIGKRGLQVINHFWGLHKKPPMDLPKTTNVSVRQTLDILCKEWGAEFHVREGAVIIKEKEKPFVLDKGLPHEEQLRILLKRERAQIKRLEEIPDGDETTLLDVGLQNATAKQINVLKGYPVHELLLEYPKIREVPSAVSGLPLRMFAIIGCEHLEDISGLAGSNVKQLIIEEGKFKSIEVVKELKALEHLALHQVPVNDISPLKGLPLKTVSLNYTDVTDFTPLKGMKLRNLDIWGKGLKDISFVKGMPLKDLNIWGSEVEDIDVLKNMPIRLLDITGTRIQDVSVLSTLPLRELRIDPSAGENSIEVIPKIKTLKRVLIPSKEGGGYVDAYTPAEYIEHLKSLKKAPAQ